MRTVGQIPAQGEGIARFAVRFDCTRAKRAIAHGYKIDMFYDFLKIYIYRLEKGERHMRTMQYSHSDKLCGVVDSRGS